MKLKVNKSLNEDTLQDVTRELGKEIAAETAEAAKEMQDLGNLHIEAVTEEDAIEGDIEQALNDALSRAREIQQEIEIMEEDDEEISPDELGFAQNVLIVGPAGTGKTARVKAWCKANGITLIHKDAKTMDPTDLGGIISRQVDEAGKQLNTATKLTNTEFDQLDTPDTILFLDELNRAPREVAGSLLTLIQDHSIVDHSSPTGFRILKGFLFTVAAVNPSSGEYDVEPLDMAMKTRFGTTEITYDNLHQLQYLTKLYSRVVNNPKQSPENRLKNYNRYQIARKLLTDPRFHFDTAEEEAELEGTDYQALNYRSFTELLNASTGKDDFLSKWSRFCNPNKYNTVEDILDDYLDYDFEDLNDEGFADIEDKANSVFNENPFTKNDYWSDVQKYL